MCDGTPTFRPFSFRSRTVCLLTIRPLTIRPSHPHPHPYRHPRPHPQIKLGRIVRGQMVGGQNEKGRNERSPPCSFLM